MVGKPGRSGRRKSTEDKVAVQVRLLPELLEGLDELVAEYQSAAPASEVSRASVLRYLLERELEQRKKARKGTKR